MKINLNADMAESFGQYHQGDDESLMNIVKSINIACGMHGGDPTVMYQAVTMAKKKNVSIGAHPGFNDLWGFGRRYITMKPKDLEYLIAYQIGALQGIAHYSGVSVTHVKVHGALNLMASRDRDYAMAIARAIHTVDKTLINLVQPETEMELASRELGLSYALEAFVDRTYEDDGHLTPRKIPGSIIKDPVFAAERAVRMIQTGKIIARSGKELALKFHSLCIHGDEPTAVEVAKQTSAAIEKAGIENVPLPEMLM